MYMYTAYLFRLITQYVVVEGQRSQKSQQHILAYKQYTLANKSKGVNNMNNAENLKNNPTV